jgi:hypothetical protein
MTNVNIQKVILKLFITIFLSISIYYYNINIDFFN